MSAHLALCRRLRLHLVAACVVIFTSAHSAAVAQTQPVIREPVLLSHRGLVRHAPENTLPAFEAAIALGASIELDVYQTSDGQLVVIHDLSLIHISEPTRPY